jgi:general stress protein 26
MAENDIPITPKAVERLRELVDPAPVCMFASRLGQIPAHVCPMQVQEVDEDGDLWFFSGSDSEHNGHLELDPQVQLFFSNPDADEYLTIHGVAHVLRDAEKVRDLWKPMVKEWFPEGREDPRLTLLRVEPLSAHCWKTRDGRPVSMDVIPAGASRA